MFNAGGDDIEASLGYEDSQKSSVSSSASSFGKLSDSDDSWEIKNAKGKVPDAQENAEDTEQEMTGVGM